MAKWADYGISAVRYDSEGEHIAKVKVREDKGETIGAAEEWTRSQVVSAMGKDKTFVTIIRGDDNKWHKGQDVHIIKIKDVKYIRTDKNRTAADNLENLPGF